MFVFAEMISLNSLKTACSLSGHKTGAEERFLLWEGEFIFLLAEAFDDAASYSVYEVMAYLCQIEDTVKWRCSVPKN